MPPGRASTRRKRAPKSDQWGRKPTDHPKLDRKLNDRAERGGVGHLARHRHAQARRATSTRDYAKAGGKRGRKLDLINGDVVELPNSQLRKLADNKCVLSIVHDRNDRRRDEPRGGRLRCARRPGSS